MSFSMLVFGCFHRVCIWWAMVRTGRNGVCSEWCLINTINISHNSVFSHFADGHAAMWLKCLWHWKTQYFRHNFAVCMHDPWPVSASHLHHLFHNLCKFSVGIRLGLLQNQPLSSWPPMCVGLKTFSILVYLLLAATFSKLPTSMCVHLNVWRFWSFDMDNCSQLTTPFVFVGLRMCMATFS